MTPAQQAALEQLSGRALTEGEVAQIPSLIVAGDLTAIAALLSLRADGLPRTRVVARRLSELGVRALPVLPRSRYALLQVLRDAATQTPAWLSTVLTAVGVPAEDHASLADDLASAHGWLLNADGLDVGSTVARNMLDVIAAAVPTAADACAAVKALAEQPDPIDWRAVAAALESV